MVLANSETPKTADMLLYGVGCCMESSTCGLQQRAKNKIQPPALNEHDVTPNEVVVVVVVVPPHAHTHTHRATHHPSISIKHARHTFINIAYD